MMGRGFKNPSGISWNGMQNITSPVFQAAAHLFLFHEAGYFTAESDLFVIYNLSDRASSFDQNKTLKTPENKNLNTTLI